LSVGSPFQECSKCRTQVSRPSTNEWALLGSGEKTYWLCDRIAPFLLLGLAPALAYWALVIRDGTGDTRVLIALLSGGPLLLLFFPLSGALHAIRRSRARMADPMYRARLIEFGRRGLTRTAAATRKAD